MAVHLPELNPGQKTNLIAIGISALVIIYNVSSTFSSLQDRIAEQTRRVEQLEVSKNLDHDLLTRLDTKLTYITSQLDRLVSPPIVGTPKQ